MHAVTLTLPDPEDTEETISGEGGNTKSSTKLGRRGGKKKGISVACLFVCTCRAMCVHAHAYLLMYSVCEYVCACRVYNVFVSQS